MPTPSERPRAEGRFASPVTTAPDEARDDALARAFLWGHLALGLQAPTSATQERLNAAQPRRMLAAAAERLDPRGHTAGLSAAAARLAARPGESLEERRNRYDRLFGHTARGPVCCFETEYGNEGLFRQPHELAHIGGYYEAFGLGARGVDAERVDHVACECEYMGFLAAKEAHQLTGGEDADQEQFQTTRSAASSFLREHLGRFGTAFGTRLRNASPEGFFGDLASLLLALLELEAKRLGLPPGPATLDLRPPEVDSTPMACGTCDVPGVGPRRPDAS